MAWRTDSPCNTYGCLLFPLIQHRYRVAVTTLIAKGVRMSVAHGKKVFIEYTLTLENKEVVDSNVGKEPLVFEQGASQIIVGLEKAMEGMQVGDTKDITVAPEEAYGPVFPEAVIEVGVEQLPEGARTVGAMVQGPGPNGQPVQGMVSVIEQGKAKVDFNHPLAGKTLFFNVKAVNIQ